MMLKVETLASRYGRIPALKGIELQVGEGELVALTDPAVLARAARGDIQLCSFASLTRS